MISFRNIGNAQDAAQFTKTAGGMIIKDKRKLKCTVCDIIRPIDYEYHNVGALTAGLIISAGFSVKCDIINCEGHMVMM